MTWTWQPRGRVQGAPEGVLVESGRSRSLRGDEIMTPALDTLALRGSRPAKSRRRQRGIELVSALPTAAWLALVAAGSIVVHLGLALTTPAPWIVPDEIVYSELAKSFAQSGVFEVRGSSFSAWTYGPLYPILIAPAYLLGAIGGQAFLLVKVINSVLVSGAVVPTFLLARRVVDRRWALLLAALVVLVPSTIYTTKIMTESLAYPLFFVAMLAIVRLLERPSISRELVALAAILLATLARAEMAVLLPGLLTAILLLAVAEARAVGEGIRTGSFVRRLSAGRISWATAGGLTLLLGVLALAHRASLAALGAHVGVLRHVRVFDLLPRLAYHVADLDLYVGVVPLAAFVVVVWRALSARVVDRRLRVFAAASTGVFAWMLAVPVLYSTAFGHVYDRYVFYLVPLLLIGLFVWIADGLPRPGRLGVVMAVVLVALPVALPFEALLDGREWGTSSSTVALVPWFWLSLLVGTGWLLKLLVLSFTVSLAWAVVRPRRVKSASLVRIVTLNLVVTGLFVFVGNWIQADTARKYAGDHPLGWIDRLVGQDARVAAVWSGDSKADERRSFAIWESELVNRSVDRVYYVREPLGDSLPSSRVRIKDGRIISTDGTPIQSAYLLAGRAVWLKGEVIAEDRSTGLILYRAPS